MIKKDSRTETIGVPPSAFQLNKKRYRNSDGIKAEILSLTRNGALPTQIMYQGNLSFTQIRDHLPTLNDTGFLNVQEIEGHKVYTTTEKGIKWLQAYQQLKEIK